MKCCGMGVQFSTIGPKIYVCVWSCTTSTGPRTRTGSHCQNRKAILADRDARRCCSLVTSRWWVCFVWNRIVVASILLAGIQTYG